MFRWGVIQAGRKIHRRIREIHQRKFEYCLGNVRFTERKPPGKQAAGTDARWLLRCSISWRIRRTFADLSASAKRTRLTFASVC